MRNISVKLYIYILNLDQWFKDNSYLELLQPFCSVQQNHLCNLEGILGNISL